MRNADSGGQLASSCGEIMDNLDLGATLLSEGARFRVWAPKVRRLAVRVFSKHGVRVTELREEGHGYFSGIAAGAKAGDRYNYILDQQLERPDPASRFQPEGVHGPSQIVDLESYTWSDGSWKNRPLNNYIIYELHVGTFTPEGTFASVIQKLDYLAELGITAVELMPVVEFPGNRNWGYDGVYPFAPHSSYGGPDRLKRLIDACHERQLAVILDVVYNHLGPEGNYLHDFGFYFTDHYRTPWGDAMNFDGPYSDHVRNYFVRNALYWFREYHVDALRLDAVHGIYDFTPHHFLQELASAVRLEEERLGRKLYLIAESDLNDVRIIKSPVEGGYGLEAQWCDDFHHALHSLLTGERDGYYVDFGRSSHLATALRDNFVYSGQYSGYRRRRHGSSAEGLPAERFIVFSQNHDQVGNRMFGERLTALVSFESVKLAAGMVLLSPFIPLLFMGEEYGEKNPFLYFVSHTDRDLIAAVRAGRKEEFREFYARGEPPDPEAEETFLRSKLDWEKLPTENHRRMLSFTRRLIELRTSIPALSVSVENRREIGSCCEGDLLWIMRSRGEDTVVCLFNVKESDTRFQFPPWEGRWFKLLDSASLEWGGPGTLLPDEFKEPTEALIRGRNCALYRKSLV